MNAKAFFKAFAFFFDGGLYKKKMAILMKRRFYQEAKDYENNQICERKEN